MDLFSASDEALTHVEGAVSVVCNQIGAFRSEERGGKDGVPSERVGETPSPAWNATSMSAAIEQESRIVIRTDWDGYQKVQEAIGDGHVRATYCEGTLELMSPSLEHEKLKKLWAALLEDSLLHCGVEFVSGGSTTFDREDLRKGFEPDDCYWLERLPEMTHARRFDPHRHPAPDLVLEVVVSRGVVGRLSVMWDLGVGEVWVLEEGRILVRVRGERGWVETAGSQCVPDVDVRLLEKALEMRHTRNEAAIRMTFRQWLEAPSEQPAP
jgi:Uma2 family endonuclease